MCKLLFTNSFWGNWKLDLINLGWWHRICNLSFEKDLLLVIQSFIDKQEDHNYQNGQKVLSQMWNNVLREKFNFYFQVVFC